MCFEHLSPFAPQAVVAPVELRAYSGRSAFLLPCPDEEGFTSNNTMLFAMYRMGYHGRPPALWGGRPAGDNRYAMQDKQSPVAP